MKSSIRWKGISFFISLFIGVPLLSILISFLEFNSEIWLHLWETRLLELIWNTIRLSLGVAFGSFVVGTGLAWIIVMYEFPGRKFFEWAMILPMAMPAYVIGFVTLSAFEYDGVIPNLLFYLFGIEGWYPELRSWLGVVSVMILVLYPYVYLFARTAFKEQNTTLLEAARSLGASRYKLFFKVALPLARPSLVAGVSLALMESLADFGTVGVFSYDTFTTAIYDVWFGLFDRSAATQLASMLLVFNFLVFWIEAKTRGKSKYFQTQGTIRSPKRFRLKPWQSIFFTGLPALILFVSFIFPLLILIYWALQHLDNLNGERFLEFTMNTLILGFISGFIILFLAIILGYANRLSQSKWSRLFSRFATLGYAIPGSVIAVGILIPMAALDHWIDYVSISLFQTSKGMLLTGSIFGILFAYTVRFMTVGFNAVESSLIKITPNMDNAAQSLGSSKFDVLRRVHFPMIKTGLITGLILVMVDVMKEMPATLLLRPFGYDTLATWIWQLMSESLAEEAALPALTIVLSSLLPVIFLIRLTSGKKR